MRAGQEPGGLVLIVEDNRNISEMVGEYLEGRGFEVDYAADGLDGYRLATENSYDVIVLDLMLPRLDGIEVCKRLREDARKSTPVLMLTARDTLDEKLTGLSSGADDYLTKPFAIQELEARLRALNPLAPIVRAERSNVPLDQVLGLHAFDLERILEVKPDFVNPPHGAEGHVHDEHCGHDHGHDHVHDEHCSHEHHDHGHDHAHGPRGHSHEDDIKGVSLTLDRPLNGAKFTAWLDKLLGEQGQNILRAKGIIDVQGEDRRLVFQAVHMILEGDLQKPWGDKERRWSRAVFIGRDLDEAALKAGFEACAA